MLLIRDSFLAEAYQNIKASNKEQWTNIWFIWSGLQKFEVMLSLDV